MMMIGLMYGFTCLRDTSGNVKMLEAMSRGSPVICFGHQGAADIVDDSSGVRLAVSDPRTAIRDLAAALADLACNSKHLSGTSARAHGLDSSCVSMESQRVCYGRYLRKRFNSCEQAEEAEQAEQAEQQVVCQIGVCAE